MSHFPLLGVLWDGAGGWSWTLVLLCFLQVKVSMSLVGGDIQMAVKQGSKTGAFQ